MRLLYVKPELRDLSQGSRIAFVRQFRFMSQDNVSDKLGLTGECKRTMTRYERGNRNHKSDRTKEIAKILNVNYKAIKKYDYFNTEDLIYTLMWLEELLPRYEIDISNVPNINNDNLNVIRSFLEEWEIKRKKRLNQEISYKEYMEWKLTYEVKSYE